MIEIICDIGIDPGKHYLREKTGTLKIHGKLWEIFVFRGSLTSRVTGIRVEWL